MFSKFNRVVKSNTLLHDFKFGITVINFKKTFNKFFAKFILVIAILEFTDYHKIFSFWQILSKHF